MDVYPEQLIIILGALFILAWIELKMRVLSRKIAQSTVQGVGIWLFIAGGLVFIASSFGLVDQNYGLYLAVGGLMVYLVGWALKVWGKREALDIEAERAEYLKRVRKGLDTKDAEKTALDFLKSRVPGHLKKIASVREFKTWKIYFKGKREQYLVVVDFDGDVASWESIGELPSWLKGPY